MQRNRDTAMWLGCMVVASLGLVYALWVVPYIPTTDGPQHVLSSHIENHFSDPGSLYPEFYRILPQFAGKGFALLFGPLESVLPWRVALRVALSIIALAFAWGFAVVVLSLDRAVERRPTALLGFLIALPWALYMGFFQFVVGTTFGLFTLAFVLRRPPTTAARHVVLSILLLVQGICHIFTAVLTAAVVLPLALLAAPKGKRLHELGRMMLVGAPAAGLLALTVVGRNLRASEQQDLVWAMRDRASEISRWFSPGPGLRAWLVVLLAVAGLATTLLRARRRAGSESTSVEQTLAWVGLFFLLLALVSPLHIPGWQFFAPRYAVTAVVLGLALVRLPMRAATGPIARAAVPLLTVGCIASALVSARLHRQLASGCADALSGLDAPLHFEGPRLPMIIDPSCATPRDSPHGPIPRASLAYNIPLLYLVEHGGIGTNMFKGTPSIHAVEFVGRRRPPPPDTRALEIARSPWFDKDAKLRAAVLTELAADGMPFEGIHVYGARPEDFTVFNDRGYVTEFQRGPMFIGRFEGCPAELLLPPTTLDPGPVYYEYGLFSRAFLNPEPRSFGTRLVPRDTPVVDGAIHVPLAARPCGEIWVRVFWDVDGSSSFTPGDRACANGQKHWGERVRANVNRDHATVTCASPLL